MLGQIVAGRKPAPLSDSILESHIMEAGIKGRTVRKTRSPNPCDLFTETARKTGRDLTETPD
jgi:hypothetical protein